MDVDIDYFGAKATAMELVGKYSPSGIIAAFTSASCILSLVVVSRSLKGFWNGLTQAPHNPVKMVQIETTQNIVLQCIV